MATIGFLLDFEIGHVFPTFDLARALRKVGHDVYYLGIDDIGSCVRDQGFEFEPVFEEIYPAGTPTRLRNRAQAGARAGGRVVGKAHFAPLTRGILDDGWARRRPDLIIASYFVSLESLIVHYRYEVPIMILTPYLRSAEDTPAKAALESFMELGPAAHEVTQYALGRLRGIGGQVHRIDQLVAPMVGIPELIPCPSELDLPDVDLGDSVSYIGPSIRTESEKGDDFFGADFSDDGTLVYVSIGSQIDLYREKARQVYEMVLELARGPHGGDWRFIVSQGSAELDLSMGVPRNVKIFEWVPQLAILQRASVMVTHGGLGTVKECIHSGVPMVVLPMDRDQPANAARVQHHRLGLKLDPEEWTVAGLSNAIRQVLKEPQFARAVAEMARIFRERQRGVLGVEIVEGVLARPSR